MHDFQRMCFQVFGQGSDGLKLQSSQLLLLGAPTLSLSVATLCKRSPRSALIRPTVVGEPFTRASAKRRKTVNIPPIEDRGHCLAAPTAVEARGSSKLADDEFPQRRGFVEPEWELLRHSDRVIAEGWTSHPTRVRSEPRLACW
jgi:hypothetical protein